MNAHIRQGVFGKWFLFDPTNPLRAWSGSRWVGCTPHGIPTEFVQLCNFESEQDAMDYVAQVKQ